MKHCIALLFLGCSIEILLENIRPAGQYKLSSGTYDGIEWLDKIQTKPTRNEIDQALIDCQIKNSPADPTNDKITVQDKQLPLDERFNSLLNILGLEKQ